MSFLAKASLLPVLAAFAAGAFLSEPDASAEILRNAQPIPVLKEGAWDTLKLTWTKPEADDTHWGNPIGNGSIGAKIKGGVDTEILQLNDKHFWSDWPRDITDPKRQDALAETRKKLAAGDIPGAGDAARKMWGPGEPGSYLPIGKLYVDFDNQRDPKNYLRELDLNRAVSTVSYSVDGVTYTREAFASLPDQVLVMRVSADKPGKLNFTARLAWPVEMEGHASVVAEDGTLVLKGKAPSVDRKTWDDKKGMTYESRLSIKAQGGSVNVKDNTLRVEGADSAVFLFANATSYNGYLKEPGTEGVDPSPIVKEVMAKASAKSYDDLLAAHLQDYQPLFHRLWVQLNGESPNKYVLGLQYARYEMISVSRDGDRPHNQQGMWSHEWRAMSNSCHFLNENVEKYYGLIEAANLPECGAPLWNWMAELADRGAITAKTDWGFHGWLAPHYSDIWASTTLKGGNNEWAIWPMGGIWLCQNLWDHYAFSGDRKFLQERAYPILKGAAEFALDYLVENKKGQLLTSPSTSPENQFRLFEGGPTYAVSEGSTMDQAMIRELFENCIAAATILNVDPEFKARLEAAIPKMLPLQVGKNGELQEWSEDYPKRDNGHRHASQVVSAWPFRQINEFYTPELFAAAKVALENRGGGGYHPDKGAMWARLREGDKSINAKDSFYTGGSLVGQFPPKYAGFAEMLLQSQVPVGGKISELAKLNFEIELLPALPSTWTEGKVDGLRARGGYEVSLEWKQGELFKCRIDSKFGTTPVVRYKGKILDVAGDSRVSVNLLPPSSK